ncbi:MAG: LPD23 domain-containing protein [Methylococcales bacterium]|nr:LPD23 domain-containing protein [Methylococcales bacterium]
MASAALRTVPDSLVFDGDVRGGIRQSNQEKPIVLVDDPDMPVEGSVRELVRYLLNKYRDLKVKNKATGNEIRFYREGVESSVKNRNLLAKRVYAVLPQLLAESSYDGYADNTKQDKKPHILGYETYSTKVEIDGAVYPVKILVDLVKNNVRGRGYYYHQVEDITLDEPVGSPRALLNNETETATPDSSNADENITQDGKPRYSFAGENAQTADKYQLSTAKERLANGENAEQVRKDTG